MQGGADADGGEFAGLPMPLDGIGAIAVVLQAGSARRGTGSGQKLVAALQPVAAGSGHAESDDTLPAAASDGTVQGGQSLDLTEALHLEAYFPDTACVKPHIHFPVDWVLPRRSR